MHRRDVPDLDPTTRVRDDSGCIYRVEQVASFGIYFSADAGETHFMSHGQFANVFEEVK